MLQWDQSAASASASYKGGELVLHGTQRKRPTLPRPLSATSGLHQRSAVRSGGLPPSTSIGRDPGSLSPAHETGPRMGALRTRVAPVGRPFPKGNPGGGRPKGVPNKATLEIKDFGRSFLMSDKYRETLKRRIMAGAAPHMEVLLHHYSFGKPRFQVGDVEVAPPRHDPALVEVVKRMTKEERREFAAISRRGQALWDTAQARLAAAAEPLATVQPPVPDQRRDASEPTG